MRKLRKLTLSFVLLLVCISAGVFAQGKLTGYTTWDDNYFYAGFYVDDPNVTGANSKFNSNPWEDDSVEVFLETDNGHHQGRAKTSFHMAVSCANGSAFTSGTDAGKWERKPIVSFKYASSVDGSINSPDDLDVGYTVELALPWYELGVAPPTPGSLMSFNVVVRMKGDTAKFISLSSKVKTEEDIHDASKWVDIVFTGPVFGAATLSTDKIVSARYISRLPLIDGEIKLNEWNKNTSFPLALPIEAPKVARNQFQKMLLTYYSYWYQGDPRKAAPTGHVREADGTIGLTDQPMRSAGPWLSYDRVQWHKDELTDIRRAGIDIVLPVYWGDNANRTRFAAKGLDCMVEALRELKSEKKPYPMVGLFFDTTAMSQAYGSEPDLRDAEVQKTFYGMIHDFFDRVPAEYRAQVQMGDERAGRPCYIVDLYTSDCFTDMDPSFIAYVNKRFQEDFDAGILWLGGKDFKDKIVGLDGYCSYGAGLAPGFDDTAKLKIASVGAGYDDTAVAGRTTAIRPRMDGATYRADWTQMLEKRPQWIIVDGWNELHEGSDICASRQYGSAYIDATAQQSLKFRGTKNFDAKYLRNDVPRVIIPENVHHVDILVQNDGAMPWKASEGYALSYRWYQDGRMVAESGIKRPIQDDILPGCSAEISIGVAAVRKDGEKLPEGNYEMRFDMVRMKDEKWFSSFGDEAFSVPVVVGNPLDVQAGYLSVDGPVMLKTATPYKFRLKVRNDGAAPWKAGSAVGCKLFKVSNYVHGGPGDVREEVPIKPIKANFLKEVAPGEAVVVEVTVSLNGPSGQPVPVWKQSDPWSYQLRFDVWDGSRWLSEAGAKTCDRTVDVFDADYGADIIAADVPAALNAGQSYDVKLLVKNKGVAPWDPKKHSFGYHWYYLDGTEAIWEGEKTPVKTAVKPGDPAVVMAKVTTPLYDGRYILAFDFAEADRWASTEEISRGGDLLTIEVTVENGKLAFADLSKLCDTVAASPDASCNVGNFDGNGLSFPAEFMLPDIGMGKPNDIYPCGYLGKADGAGLGSPRHISFRYAGKSADAKDAVTCAGQVVSVQAGQYARLHVLGAAVSPDQNAEFSLQYQPSAESAQVVMSSWSAEPTHGEETAFTTLHRHSATGDERGVKCRLFHYTIPLNASRTLTGIVLPKNDKVRVVAITLEKP